MKVKMNLKGHESMQCEVVFTRTREGERVIDLVSYVTPVIKCTRIEDSNDYVITAEGTYWDKERVFTPTTARQISYFLREYFPDITYQDYKKVAEGKQDKLIVKCMKPLEHIWREV